MPKVSEYELEHLNDDNNFKPKKKKKTKLPKEKKYTDKKDYRVDWKKAQKVKESVEDDFDLEEE